MMIFRLKKYFDRLFHLERQHVFNKWKLFVKQSIKYDQEFKTHFTITPDEFVVEEVEIFKLATVEQEQLLAANSYYSLRRLNIEKHSLSEMSSKKHATTANSIQSSRPLHLWQTCRIRVYGTLMSKPNTFMTLISRDSTRNFKRCR